jgi:hypothetical protein
LLHRSLVLTFLAMVLKIPSTMTDYIYSLLSHRIKYVFH